MSDAMLRVMGGPTKAEARAIIKRLTGQEPAEEYEENAGARVPQIFGYEDALAVLAKAPRSGRIGANTFITEPSGPEDGIAVWLYKTKILEFFPNDTVAINSGGYHTVTTKARINAILPGTVRVYAKRYNWYVVTPEGEQEFHDGIRVALRGYARNEEQRGGVHVDIHSHNPDRSARIRQLIHEGYPDGRGQAAAIAYRESREGNPRGDELVGYIDANARNAVLTDYHGRSLGWRFDSTVSNWRTMDGDRIYAIHLVKGSGRRKQHAGGLWLGDKGSLFRGRVFGIVNELDATAMRDLGNGIMSEAESWAERDAEDEQEQEGEEEE